MITMKLEDFCEKHQISMNDIELINGYLEKHKDNKECLNLYNEIQNALSKKKIRNLSYVNFYYASYFVMFFIFNNVKLNGINTMFDHLFFAFLLSFLWAFLLQIILVGIYNTFWNKNDNFCDIHEKELSKQINKFKKDQHFLFHKQLQPNFINSEILFQDSIFKII